PVLRTISTTGGTATAQIGVHPASPDMTISRADFYSSDGTFIASTTQSPFSVSVNGLDVGEHLFYAIATDPFGRKYTSVSSKITVRAALSAAVGGRYQRGTIGANGVATDDLTHFVVPLDYQKGVPLEATGDNQSLFGQGVKPWFLRTKKPDVLP